MEPFGKEGDFVLINKLSYLLSYPKIGDVIVARHPEEKKKIIKRITGLRKDGKEVSFWVEGDNKEESGDSRFFGWIPQKFILGRAKVIHKTGH